MCSGSASAMIPGTHAMPIDFDPYDVLTFDCYGTLIDWETGLLAALRSAAPQLGSVGDDLLLESYARHEAEAERPPYRSYREVLAAGLRGVAADNGLEPAVEAVEVFSECVRDWPAFPDSADALRRLQQRFRLGVITNCDTDLFTASTERLGVDFDWVVTAEVARSYKPGLAGFELAFETIPVPRARILHVAQSLFHDHVPAKRLGLASVWIDRRQGRAGSGATLPAEASPGATYASMRSFADAATAAGDAS
jgi:2-haloacid dehalogenase